MIKMVEQRWKYKGHLCFISIEQEHGDGVLKAFHFITKPNGDQVLAPLDSYDCNKSLVEDWIDLNYPKRVGIAPLNKYDIKLLKSVGRAL